MKKTINISIGGMSFQIEEDAYQALENYLAAIKQKFAAYPDSAEIISDMEDRIAEQFADKAGTNKIITQIIVTELIAVMGQPEQFGEDKTQANFSATSTTSNRRLYRNPDDVILAGVCSGIAAYLGIDPVWVRLIFAVTIFFGGFGIVLYLILWAIVPEAKTDTEKMQMRGEPVNLKNIESMVKERVEELKKKDKSSVKKVLSAPFRILGQILQALGRLIKKLFPLVFKIIGFFITIGASLGLAGLVFATISLVFNANSPYVDFPLRELAHGALYYTALLSAFFVAFVPVIFVILLGTSLMSFKPTINKMGGFSLLGLWVLALILLVNAGVKLAPQIESLTQTSPYFHNITKEYSVKDFSAIELSGADELVIYPGENFKVTAQGTEKDIENVQVAVNDNILKLNRDNKIKVCLFCNLKSIKYTVYAPDINNISASGASRVFADNLKTANLQITLSGASRGTVSTQSKQTIAKLSGASRLEIKGNSDAFQLTSFGASRVLAEGTKINNATIELSGASRASFGNVENLEVKASGASTVTYMSVKNLKQNLSGSSRVKQNSGLDEYDSYSYQPEADKQYANDFYGFKFNYPGSYIMQTGTSTNSSYYLPIETYFYQNKPSTQIISAHLPKDSFPEYTDFQGGFLNVSAVKGLTQTQCTKFGNQAVLENQKFELNNISYSIANASDAGMGHQAVNKIYHTFNNNTCFEIVEGVRTGGFGADDNITEQVSKTEVFDKLEPILQSLEFGK